MLVVLIGLAVLAGIFFVVFWWALRDPEPQVFLTDRGTVRQDLPSGLAVYSSPGLPEIDVSRQLRAMMTGDEFTGAEPGPGSWRDPDPSPLPSDLERYGDDQGAGAGDPAGDQ